MNFYEYWIGKDIDLAEVWKAFDEGKGYIEKYKTMEVYMLRIGFENYSSNSPLFDHEAVSKTIKSLFHDFKRECLSDSEYNEFGPIFIYEINRGSALWSFLAELKPLLVFSTVLSAALLWKKFEGQSLNNLEKKISIIKKYFPQATDIDVKNFVNAWTFLGRKKVLNKLIEQGLKKIEISDKPFKGDKSKIEFVNMSEIIIKTDSD
jgi:hypothetical protein